VNNNNLNYYQFKYQDIEMHFVFKDNIRQYFYTSNRKFWLIVDWKRATQDLNFKTFYDMLKYIKKNDESKI
jgi:hypothetical protein